MLFRDCLARDANAIGNYPFALLDEVKRTPDHCSHSCKLGIYTWVPIYVKDEWRLVVLCAVLHLYIYSPINNFLRSIDKTFAMQICKSPIVISPLKAELCNVD
jgi:hypothetical protein